MKYFTSIVITLLTLSAHSEPKGHLVCDKDNYFIFSVDDGVFQLVGSSKFQLTKDWKDLRYNFYGAEDFISVTFSDEKMESAVLEQGRMWAYGDVDEDSVVKTELSQSYCK